MMLQSDDERDVRLKDGVNVSVGTDGRCSQR